jgi:rod shape-determining protein MreD
MNKSHSILFFVLVFLLQLVISDFLHLGPWVTVCLLPFMILQIPLSRRPHVVMLSAFGLGLLLDFLSAGALGLNAFAAVMAAAPRRFLYRLLVNRDRQDKTEIPTLRSAGNAKYIKYLLALTAIYVIAFVLLDCVSFRPVGFIIVRILASTVVSTALGILLAISFQHQH